MTTLATLRHAVRLMGRSPLFTVAAVLSLALGIAASSAVFSVADGLLAPAVGVRDAARVVDVGRGNRGTGFDNMSHPAFEYLRAHATTFEGLAGVDFAGRPMALTAGGVSERVFGAVVSSNFFAVLGTRAVLGRFFRPDEDLTPGQRPVAVLTHRFWTRRLGGDPTVLDRPLRLNNMDVTVVGVAEPGFEGVTLAGTDVWMPMAMVAEARGLASARLLSDPGSVWHIGVGRLKPGVTRPQAQAELNTLMQQFIAATPGANPRHTIALLPTSRIPGPMRTPFLVFLGAMSALAAALLVIACSNVAGMLLARASTRRREMATRLAIGASRGRLLTQLLTESGVLFLAAAVLAVPATIGLLALLERALPVVPVLLNLGLGITPRVIAYAFGVSAACALAFGLAPARHALGGDLAPLLGGHASTTDQRRLWLRNALVVAQVALSLMLVVTAGLFARTLQQAARINPGFTTADITLANVDVSLSGYRGAQATALVQRLEERLAGLSGVASVAAARMIPLQGSGFGLGRVRVPGSYDGSDGERDVVAADWNVVTPSYFDTVRMPLVAGRAFGPGDREATARVAIVNETFARTAWPGRPAVGQRFLQQDRGDAEVPVEVVGVVADAKYRYISDPPRAFVFVPFAQQPVGDVTFFVKHAPGRDPSGEVRAAVAQVDDSVPVLFVQSFDEAVALGLAPQRITAWMAGAVGMVGAGLAALGLYGLMAFGVTQRTREIGIRMALGASARDVRRMVARQGARLTLIGVALGTVLAAAIATALRGLLVGVGVADPLSYAATTLLFVAVLAAACWAPAARAAATEPARTLRAE